jgi:hypothetical protein
LPKIPKQTEQQRKKQRLLQKQPAKKESSNERIIVAVKNIVKAIPLSSIDSATFTGSYQLLSATAGIPNACFMLRVVNNCNKDITISYDGTNNHDFIPTMTSENLGVQQNSQPNNFIANFSQGQKVWIKGDAGTGLVYLAGYYQPSVG